MFAGTAWSSGDTVLPYCTVRVFWEGRDAVQDDPTWRITQFNSLLPCSMLIVDGLRMTLQQKSEYVTKLCSTFWVTQTRNTLDIQWHFWGATMAVLCSCTGLIELVPKGTLLLSWTNCLYGWNLGSFIWTNLQIPIKWMEASWFSSSKESVPNTMCNEGDVHWGIWHLFGNTAPCCTSKADSKRCLLLCVPATPPSSSAQNPIILQDNARSHTAVAVIDLLRCWQSEILEHPPYSPNMIPCDTISLPMCKNSAREPVQHKRCLPNIWLKVINKGC